MHTLPAVQEDRRKFRAHIAPWVSSSDLEAIAMGIARVLEWSRTRGRELDYRSPSGSDPLLGATCARGEILFWGIYPRRSDGGKVTIFPGSAARLSKAAHRSLAAQLEHLQPGLRLEPNHNLPMSLRRLSHSDAWRAYEAVLDEAHTRASTLRT